LKIEGRRRLDVKVIPVPPPIRRRGILIFDPLCKVCIPLMSVEPRDKEGKTYRIKKVAGEYVSPFMQALKDYERMTGTYIELINFRTMPEKYLERYGKAEEGLPILVLPERTLRAIRPFLTKQQYLNMFFGKEKPVKAKDITKLEL